MSKLKRRIMVLFITLGIIVAVLFGVGYLILHSPSFGALPSGTRLERILHSPNYRDGRFQNRYPMSQGMQPSSMGDRIKILWKFLFDRPDNIRPVDSIPVVRQDLKKLDRSEDLIVWFGHSGYLLQMDGVRYLIDPVFVEGAPFGISNAFFKGTQVFDVADLPEIDYLVISHDHWDHLDYHVAKELQSRVRKVYTGLGVGAHLERWGYRPDQIVELDWGESTPTAEGGRIHCLPTQHLSGRGLTSSQSLWASFVLQGPKHSVYVGGDGGFGPHYAEIGKQFVKGIEQLTQEGAIQLFEQVGAGLDSYIVGTVGTLQFEVLEYRLKNEYNTEITMQMQPFETARWLAFPDGRTITPADLRGADRGMFVHDRNGNPVLLVSNEWALGWIRENNPDLQLGQVPFDRREA